MAEEWDWSDLLADDDDGSSKQKVSKDDPKSLRQFATKTAKENEELRKQIAEIHAAARTRSIAEKLAEKKVPEKFAKLIPADVNADKVDEWLKEYEDLWAPPASEGGQGQEEEDPQLVEERAAMGRMNSASGAGVPATRPADLMAQVNDPTLTRDQLLALIERAGGGYGIG